MIIEIAVILGSIIDLFLTYNYLKIYKKKFPKKDYAVIEANPLVRAFIRAKGLGEGVLMAGIIILAILIVLMILVSVNFKFFIAGCYYMMITFHLTNFLALRRMHGSN